VANCSYILYQRGLGRSGFEPLKANAGALIQGLKSDRRTRISNNRRRASAASSPVTTTHFSRLLKPPWRLTAALGTRSAPAKNATSAPLALPSTAGARILRRITPSVSPSTALAGAFGVIFRRSTAVITRCRGE